MASDRKKSKNVSPPQLDPDFPYTRLDFDFTFFGVDRDPEPKREE